MVGLRKPRGNLLRIEGERVQKTEKEESIGIDLTCPYQVLYLDENNQLNLT